MEKKIFYIWLGGIALFIFIGVIISLVNLNSYNYYQNQHYNNLPSLTEYETAPIQHYEQQRDESVKQTEQDPEAEVTQENGTGNDEAVYSYASDSKYIFPPLIYQDGSINLFPSAYLLGIHMGLYMGLLGYHLMGIRVKGRMGTSLAIALGVVFVLYCMGVLK